jgi:hypothetical protein
LETIGNQKNLKIRSMIIKRKWIVLFFILYFFNGFAQNSYVSYVTYGRFGDNLLAYSHAKWLAYKYDLHVLYTPFLYSDKLMLINDVVQLNVKSKYKNEKIIAINGGFRPYRIYEVPCFSDFEHEWNLFKTDWSDPIFKQCMKGLIKPIEIMQLITPKYNRLSIALHIRTTGGYDPVGTELSFLHKFPPLSFYTKELANISKIIDFAPMYVYVFTDHLSPEQLVFELKQELVSKDHIYFDYKKNVFSIEDEVLKDFFSLAQFPIIIRGDSNFSYMAARIGETCLEIFPKNNFIMNNKVCVGEVGFYIFSNEGGLYNKDTAELISKIKDGYFFNK